MFAYYCSDEAILHSVVNMDLDMALYLHIITHMEPYYTIKTSIYDSISSLALRPKHVNLLKANTKKNTLLTHTAIN